MALVSFDLDGVLQRNPFHIGRPHGVFGHICRTLAPCIADPEPEQAILRRLVALHRARAAGWLSVYVVQPLAPGYTEMPQELAALPPWERPAAGRDWLEARFAIDRRWHDYPPCTLDDCIPDAIVRHLDEVPATIGHLVQAAGCP